MSGSQRLPDFRSDGYLPTGVHVCAEAEATFRFGTGSRRRQRLAVRVRRWIELARAVGATRLLLDGSYVTAKSRPQDVDAVLLLPTSFRKLLETGNEAALERETMLLTRQPEEFFAAETLEDWNDWVEFFSRTREADRRRKGLVEVTL